MTRHDPVETVVVVDLDEEDLVRILHDMEPVKSRFGIDLDDVPIDEAFMSRLRRLAETVELEAEGGGDPGARAHTVRVRPFAPAPAIARNCPGLVPCH